MMATGRLYSGSQVAGAPAIAAGWQEHTCVWVQRGLVCSGPKERSADLEMKWGAAGSPKTKPDRKHRSPVDVIRHKWKSKGTVKFYNFIKYLLQQKTIAMSPLHMICLTQSTLITWLLPLSGAALEVLFPECLYEVTNNHSDYFC